MRIRSVVILLLMGLGGVLQAQSRAEVLSDPAKAGGLMYVYDYKADPPTTPAPKGYKPFYFSHFGRHGARYLLRHQYDTLAAVLGRVSRAGMLTPRGERLLRDYQAYYPKVRYLEGELTGVGADQERTIARRLYRRYPEIFKGPTHGTGFSTPSPRVVLSMTSFVDGLQSLDRDLDVDARSGEAYSVFLRPNFSTLDRKRPVSQAELQRPFEAYFKETVDIDGILGRIFTDPAAAVSKFRIDVPFFIRSLMSIESGQQCLEHPTDIFDGLLTLEDRIAISRADGFRIVRFLGRYEGSGGLFPDFAAYSLKDIIDKADADIASGQMQLRLRFTHDSAVIPLVVFMDINGFGRTAKTPEEAFEIFPCWRMPMAANLQLIFFRSRKSPEILVKVLWNESEAVLPFPAAQGPYYRWSDFKAYYGERIRESLALVEALPPKAGLLERYGLAAESPM